MSESTDLGGIAVKLEPQEHEHFGPNFNSKTENMSIEYNVTTPTSIEPLNHHKIEQKPVIIDNDKSHRIETKVNSVSLTSQPSPAQCEPSDINNEEPSSFRYQIAPKVELDSEIARPFSIILEGSPGEFVNEQNYVNFKLEPTSLHHESNPSDDLLDISTPKQQVDEADELLRQEHQISKCFVLDKRLQNVPQFSSDWKVKQVLGFNCRVCLKLFKNKRCLRQHENIHTNRVTCDHCNQEFGLKGSLIRHIESKHSGLSFKCIVCNKILGTYHSLQQHKRIHTKPHKCPHCDRSFANKRARDNHANSHLGHTFKCNLCDSLFGTALYLLAQA